MSLVLVSGLSGAGKSAVYRRLVQLGFEAYGFDEDRFGEWFHRESGLPVAFPAERHDSDGTADIEFRVDQQKIEDLAKDSVGRTVYLCGGAGHEFHFWELLDRVIYLMADDDTLRYRLATRIDNGYGKAPDELAGILDANQTFAGLYRDRGAVIVNAARPIDEVVSDVIVAAT